ncbi:kinesin-like protein KIF20B isoform X2 [Dunckerocampus dactyliophorus]|uniref:kinesin-like protein KIF20B isoform X2 n=1 Tax=Dunckerocampus dactyliophorus TaxID=161453 RepID=UPI0024073056|nr:kinesin-like protein KIF20B isoform X2 [Dunckerocampus dactyliophorus]
MMESCLAGKPERVGPVEVGNIKRDLLEEFSALPKPDEVPTQSENLQVYLRVRPFTAAENGESQDCVTIEGPDTVVLKAPRSSQSNRQGDKLLPQTAQRFTFTQVFGPDASQRRVFEGSVHGLVRDVLEGENCLVFTYGVTNAGKTFTFLGPDHDSGLLPRSLWVIFNSIEGRLYTRCDLKPQRCRDFSRLTPDQQTAESSSKKNLFRMLKENVTSARSTFLDSSSLSSDCSVNSVGDGEKFCLDVPSTVGFSVWVSFCEIYNDNIHDLLDQVPGHVKRTVLRLSQDVRGNSFIKDLKWIQVNSSEEAYRVMKIGKKNQSCYSTRLNHLSSRSHSIFSIRILRVDHSGVPRVLGISELALCDLAGSERCSRTHNTGERLKEAGNINSSLLTLGKCISAMRLNQHAKFQHHVPFRESKLTHFLQFFFCGAGKVTMVVNINQSSSCMDETLNVLKFSALAQKVVVLNTRPVSLDAASHRSAMELSILIDGADQRRNMMGRGRKSSLLPWETSLEDVPEDEYGEGSVVDEESEEESAMERTVLEAGEGEENKTIEEEEESDREAALRLVLEAQIREEVSAEFMELFSKMEKDYSERLEKEREVLEERAEKKLEILKNLVSKTANLSDSVLCPAKEEQAALLEGIISSVSEDLEKIRADAQSVHQCLSEHTHVAELEERQSCDQRLQAIELVDTRTPRTSEPMDTSQLEDHHVPDHATHRERLDFDTKRCRNEEDEGGRMSTKIVLLEENHRKELRESQEKRTELEAALKRQQEEVQTLKEEMQKLTAQVDECPNCDSVFSSLELERREMSRLTKENKALVNGIFQLQTEVTDLQQQLRRETEGVASMSEQLAAVKACLQGRESQSAVKAHTLNSREVKEGEGLSAVTSVFHANMAELRKESQAALEKSAQKSKLIQELQQEKNQLEERLTLSDEKCDQLSQELANQKGEHSRQLQSLRAELELEGGALRRKLEESAREEETRKTEDQKRIGELQRVLCERENLLEELVRQSDTMRQELERVKEELQSREAEERKENEEPRTEEKRPLQERKHRRRQEVDQSKELETTTGPTEYHMQECVLHVAALRNDVADMQTSKDKSAARKRKSCEVEGLASSASKRNRRRANMRNLTQQTLDTLKMHTLTDVIPKSPPALLCTAETNVIATVSKPKRGRKKLYKDDCTQLLISPNMAFEGADEAKESDHVIIKRQLRSKTSRK